MGQVLRPGLSQGVALGYMTLPRTRAGRPRHWEEPAPDGSSIGSILIVSKPRPPHGSIGTGPALVISKEPPPNKGEGRRLRNLSVWHKISRFARNDADCGGRNDVMGRVV